MTTAQSLRGSNIVAVAPERPHVASAAPRRTRVSSIDFTKGVLVYVMVLYHWLNYFVVITFDVYRYLRFLTPSFIFITGFLVSSAYLGRYSGNERRLTRRLVQRGLKIVGLFLVLNVGGFVGWVDPSRGLNAVVWRFLSSLAGVFVSGGVVVPNGGKNVSFYILVPIGYLLLVSALLANMRRRFALAFEAALALILAAVLMLFLAGLESPNLELLGVGIVGVLVGRVPMDRVNAWASHSVLAVTAYVLYLVAITVWNVRYPLQIAGVCMSVLLIYTIGERRTNPGILTRHLILAGRLSLFAYIAQLAILQMLRRSLRGVEIDASTLAISFVAATCLMALAIEVLDRGRSRVGAVNWLYGAVFS